MLYRILAMVVIGAIASAVFRHKAKLNADARRDQATLKASAAKQQTEGIAD